jgi:hypothetical protein
MQPKSVVVLLGALIACAGCESAYSRKPDTVSAVQGRLSDVSYLSDADLLSEEWSQQFQAARRFVRARQCEARAPNPLIHISPPLGSGAKTAAPGNELPLRVSTVANVPNEYLKDMTALAEAPGMPREMAERLRREIPGNYDKLSARVRLLIGEFDPRGCYRQTMHQRRWSDIIDLPVNP